MYRSRISFSSSSSGGGDEAEGEAEDIGLSFFLSADRIHDENGEDGGRAGGFLRAKPLQQEICVRGPGGYLQ